MKNAYYNYCESELTMLNFVLKAHATDPNYAWVNPVESVNNTIQRCLGAGEFVQSQGLDYVDVEEIFNFFHGEFQKVLDKYS